MTWEEKFAAIKSLSGSASMWMRAPGDWYVCSGVEIGGDGLLRTVCGDGATPEAAVNAWWSEAVTNLPIDRHLRAPGRPDETRFRWNGFRWAAVAL